MTRGELINRRARAGAELTRAREMLAKIPQSKIKERAAQKKIVDLALAFYGQCLWDEEHWQLQQPDEEFFTW